MRHLFIIALTAWQLAAPQHLRIWGVVADRTVFVDGTTSGTPGTTGAHYATLQAAITGEVGAAANLVTGTAILHIECSVFSGNAADTTAVTINGFTTNASYYVHIYPASRHAGVWDATKYRLDVANAISLRIQDNFVWVDGLQIGKTATSGDDQGGVQIDSVDAGAVINLSSLIIRNYASGSRQVGIYIVDTDAPTVNIWNTIVYGLPDIFSFYNSGLFIDFGATVNIYSSTFIGGHFGIGNSATATINAKNVYASFLDSIAGAAFSTAGGALNQTTCASSDTTATGTALDSIAVNTTNFTNVTGGSEDFHLPLGSALINVGTDTSGESAPLNFTTDIDGQTRSGTWDVGADEYVAAGGGAVVRLFFFDDGYGDLFGFPVN
jgi:hypothetical protein